MTDKLSLKDLLYDPNHEKELKILGKGNFSVVYLVRDKREGKKYALKKVKRSNNKVKEKEIKKEVKIMSKLNHPNILKCYGYEKDDSFHYLILKYVSRGTIADQLPKIFQFSEDEKIEIFRQICKGVNHLHKKKVTH